MAKNEDRELGLRWSRRLSLRRRILAVNIFAILIIAGSLFYLDSFRSRLTQARVNQAQAEAVMIAHMLTVIPRERRPVILSRLGLDSGTRLQVYGRSGRLEADSWAIGGPNYELRDPSTEPWYRGVARALDNGFDAIVGARRRPPYQPPAVDNLAAWPEAQAALARRRACARSSSPRSTSARSGPGSGGCGSCRDRTGCRRGWRGRRC